MALRIYEVLWADNNGSIASTCCGFSLEKAKEVYNRQIKWANDVCLKSYSERGNDDKIVCEYHREN